MNSEKKRKRSDQLHSKKKRFKKAVSTSVARGSTSELNDDQCFDLKTVELLQAQNIREGMLLLGCVTEIKSTFLWMSLPGYLYGRVSLYNISDAFTKSLSDFASSSEYEEPSISSLVKVGMVFPCKVMKISYDLRKRKPLIDLSINPSDVNADIKSTSLYRKMVLYVSICSLEDHGYIVDVGTNSIQGFLSTQGFENNSQTLKIGEVIPACVKRIDFSIKKCVKIQFLPLDFNQDFPEISTENIKLSSILPGAKIRADVIEVQHPFVHLKFSYFNAVASLLTLGAAYQSIKIGSSVSGTVLSVHPITHVIYVMLNSKPSPDVFAQYFSLKPFSCIKNPKYLYRHKSCAYYKIGKGMCGFIRTKDLGDKVSKLSKREIPKACALNFHYMDNLIEMSANPSLVGKDFVSLADVKIGDIYEAVVGKHIQNGMYVKICPGLFGFVRRIHMSDVFVTKPEVLFPLRSKVKCRVLSVDVRKKLNLTCKESLLNLQHPYILSSYDGIQKGQLYKGVIAQKTEDYIIVAFFGDTKGIVSGSHLPVGSIFYEGQSVLCEVLHCNSLKKKLTLLLKTEGGLSIEEKGDFWNESPENSFLQNNQRDIDMGKTKKIMNITEFSSEKPAKAVIKSVKVDRLNILLNSAKAKVHITEVGCTSEGTYPLKEFSAGQKIQVHIFGESLKPKRTNLAITRKEFISFKECTLNCPSNSLSIDLKPGKSLMGFVKEVHAISAVLWLTNTQTGVIDYLQFSENLKVVRSLRRYLKPGLSVKVSVLDNNARVVSLTKIDKIQPQSGKNIIGLVQITCSEKGLVLKLPHGYHGSVAVTDLTDIYIPVQQLFDKYCKIKFLLCHVLEVNHDTKYCQLSLRYSRVYGKKLPSDINFCPELTGDNIKDGSVLKGYVKAVSDSIITVNLGRKLEGKIQLHNCTSIDCRSCVTTMNIINDHPVGSVTDVFIRHKSINGNSYILDFTNSEVLKNKHSSINITENFSWEEAEDGE